MPDSALYVGLMSGTSLDGIDAVLVDFDQAAPRLHACCLQPFDAPLKTELAALQRSGANELERAALAANGLAHQYAAAVRTVLNDAGVDAGKVAAIGMHGQTVRHQPGAGFTLQIGNAALLAELSGICVVSDFRSRDVAAGGQGAPLVPAFHRCVFGGTSHRVIANIGGIANVTDLPTTGLVRGWDTGPGNVLMDAWIAQHCGRAYDAEGEWAESGMADAALLTAMLADPYFRAPPPKSTGRDLFHMGWLNAHLHDRTLAPQDVQATLLELTARGLAGSVLAEAGHADEIYVCGGGARNTALLRRLRVLLAPRVLDSTAALGLHPDWVEALAFAWLARQCLQRAPGNIPAVTGATGERVLGAIYPA